MRELVVTNPQWHRQMRALCLIVWCLNCMVSIESFLTRPRPSRYHSVRCLDAAPLSAANDRKQPEPPTAFIDGYIPEEYKEILEEALQAAGFTSVHDDIDSSCVHRYTFSKATGMLRLTEANNAQQQGDFDDPPKWIPLVKGEENVLVANGWSFLDPDENEPLSAFDVHAANIESQYKPKWRDVNNDANGESGVLYDEPISSLGFSLRPQSKAQVEQEASLLADDLPRRVLLQGATDPPQRKLTANGYDFTGPSSQSDVECGVFCCPIGGLPLFTTLDLSSTTASSGWLSFSQPVCNDHVIRVEPSSDSLDQRIEVLCAKTRCHLGHYFGTEGYCINASALKFLPLNNRATIEDATLPISWRALESQATDSQSLSIKLVYDTCINTASQQGGTTETIAFGAGCFWHVEFAFRRLPGVVSTETGYAGGITTSPTYEDVCDRETQHAEVVRVTFDPSVLSPRMLVDCFLALHDPTKVRAMGKHSRGTGQYRSCIFVTNYEMERIARQTHEDCQEQLGKELSTEIRTMDPNLDSWLWRAEERHQRHDEKRLEERCSDCNDELCTLSMNEWLQRYGRSEKQVVGKRTAFNVPQIKCKTDYMNLCMS